MSRRKKIQDHSIRVFIIGKYHPAHPFGKDGMRGSSHFDKMPCSNREMAGTRIKVKVCRLSLEEEAQDYRVSVRVTCIRSLKSFQLIVTNENAARRFLRKLCWKNYRRFYIRCKFLASTKSLINATAAGVVGTNSTTSQVAFINTIRIPCTQWFLDHQAL